MGLLAGGPIKNKTVVITGGSSGIGLGLVKRFLARDNIVIATSRAATPNPPLADLQAQYGAHLRVTQLDTAQASSVQSWAASLSQHVDILVNNAGIYGKRGGFHDYTSEDLMGVFATNAVGPFLVTQQLHGRGLLGQSSPSLVVNVTSIMASHGDTTISSASGGGYAYRASKAALNIITKSLTIDLAPDSVECVLLHPGYVRGTGMTGENGWIEIDESVDGIMGALESGKLLNGGFFAYTGEQIPW